MSSQDDQALLDGMVKDMARARELGLVPDKDAKVSARGQFIVNPSSIDETEDRKMRGYRPKPWPTAVRRWGADPLTGLPGVEEKVVHDQVGLTSAEAEGWTEDWVTGPPAKAAAVTDADVAGGYDMAVPAPRRSRRVS